MTRTPTLLRPISSAAFALLAPAVLLSPALVLIPGAAAAQTMEAGLLVDRIEADPGTLRLEFGESASFSFRMFDADGNTVDAQLRIFAQGGGLQLSRDGAGGTVTAQREGSFRITATVVLPPEAGREPAVAQIPVEVSLPGVYEVRFGEHTSSLIAGTAVRLEARAFHANESERPDPGFVWSSSDEDVATVTRFGDVQAHRPGTVTITAAVDGARAELPLAVEPFPAVRMELAGGLDEARTGDVLTFSPRFIDEAGAEVTGIPVDWGYSFHPANPGRQPGGTAHLADGRFVAEEPGRFVVTASAGPLTARRAVEIGPRQVVQRVSLEGKGRVAEAHTSDFWVFEGRDGRDYAISGTWGADGYAYMWDVTDPANMVRTDSVQVDARTINDVKVSPAARYATMTREGASNRRNGLVILDLANPAHPVIASVVDEGLTGGVHNAFPMEDYVYALSAGEKYLIIDVRDLANPRVVSEVQHGDCRIHDVWVLDGLAYSAQWGCGVIVYDVGNGRWGGSPENPVFVTSLVTPGGRTHAVFPYHQESTGRFLVFAGDEILNRAGRPLEGGLSRFPYDPVTGEGGLPSNSAGYIHILDFTDFENPRKIARYEVPEYGTHNIWVEDDVLYQAYYEGGMRAVDVSGDLMGNLATQGREIAVFKPNDPVGYISNAPMVWSAMPFKGQVFFSDWNSGMWSVRLEPRQPVTLE